MDSMNLEVMYLWGDYKNVTQDEGMLLIKVFDIQQKCNKIVVFWRVMTCSSVAVY
jgi:hypothetical protein